MTSRKRPSNGDRQRGQNDVDDADAKLFRRAAAGAKPIQTDFVEPEKRAIPARARFARSDERQVLEESLLADVTQTDAGSGDSLTYCRPGVRQRTFRKLARGKFSIQDELDLHGMTVVEARQTLADFIAHAIARDFTCVRVVHGKGLGSGLAGPVLKRHVDGWLRRWDEVLAFASTRPNHGGTGAIYVLLKKT